MRVLILSASVGAGHIRAAEAVEAALRQTGAPVTIPNYDASCPRRFARATATATSKWWLARPSWEWLYDATDKPFHLGWVIVNPIPGQEEKNAIYLLEHGAGVRCDNLHTLAFKVRSVLEEPGRLETMRASAARLGGPDAGAIIARFITSPQHATEPVR